MGLPLAASARSAKQLLDDNSTKTVDNENKRSRRFLSTASLESDQEVPGNISDSVASDRLVHPMFDTGIVSMGQDAGVRDGRRKEGTGPEYGGVGIILVLVGCREKTESSCLGRGFGGFVDAIFRQPGISFLVRPCTPWVAGKPVDKDDTVLSDIGNADMVLGCLL